MNNLVKKIFDFEIGNENNKSLSFASNKIPCDLYIPSITVSKDVNITNIMFISGGSVDVLDSVHEIMQRVKSVERKKYETRTA